MRERGREGGKEGGREGGRESLQKHNHHTTAQTKHSLAQEREMEGMLCW